MLRAIADAIQVSKLRWRLVDDSQKPLSLEEAFYMATMGGGSFFGKVGTFAEGYEFDALILDDSKLRHPQPLTARERLGAEGSLYFERGGEECCARVEPENQAKPGDIVSVYLNLDKIYLFDRENKENLFYLS